MLAALEAMNVSPPLAELATTLLAVAGPKLPNAVYAALPAPAVRLDDAPEDENNSPPAEAEALALLAVAVPDTPRGPNCSSPNAPSPVPVGYHDDIVGPASP